MKKISDYFIISDVDGTLLPEGKPVPQCNIEALRRFTQKGGRFAIATGRSKEMTEDFAGALPVNAPCIVYNGGAIYDYNAKEFLMQIFLPDEAKGYLKKIQENFPHIPEMVICDTSYYNVTREMAFAGLSDAHAKLLRSAEADVLQSPWYKVLFSVSSKESPEFDKYLETNAFAGVRFIHSSNSLVEMLPEKSTKGLALEKLIGLEGISRENVVAIGDYHNDVEMLEFAAISATTIDAPDAVKAVSDKIFGTCESGAVADLIEYIESISG